MRRSRTHRFFNKKNNSHGRTKSNKSSSLSSASDKFGYLGYYSSIAGGPAVASFQQSCQTLNIATNYKDL